MMDGIEPVVKLGIFAKNVECLKLKNVTVTGHDGDLVIAEGVDKIEGK